MAHQPTSILPNILLYKSRYHSIDEIDQGPKFGIRTSILLSICTDSQILLPCAPSVDT